ncbi:MAG: AMP-dependent synthetase/ligase [Thermoplasmatota archaeon]
MEDGPQTLKQLFWNSVEANGDVTAQGWYEDGTWATRTYAELGEQVKEVAHGLLSLGVKKGDRIGIWSKNLPQWAEADMACQSMGAASVPIYDTLTGPKGAYILNNSGSKVLFVQDQTVLERVLEVRGDLKSTKTFVVIDAEGADLSADGVMSLDQLKEAGRADADKLAKKLATIGDKIKPDDLASLVYTSGTTGDPKGVMLTHGNITSNAWTASGLFRFGVGDVMLSFLPLAHVFERTGGHFAAYGRGATVMFARSIDTLTDDMKQVRPTIMMSVPRLYEKIYARVVAGVKEASFLKRFIFNWSMEVGKAANVYRTTGQPMPASLARKAKRADKLVFSKLKANFGGRLRFFIAGGAALNRDIAEFFWAADIPIFIGFGLTETSPVTHANLPGASRFGSAGRAIPAVECKIDTTQWQSQRTDVVEGEICVKGPNIMAGYYKNKKATDEVFDKDGFFHTGDVGYVDDDGYLFITDRKKEIIVMSNGKNVAPAPIEGALKLQPHIGQACVIGDDRKYMSALIVPDFEALEAYATAHGIATTDPAALVADQRIVSLFEQEVEAVNAHLARYEQLKKFWVLPVDWTPDSGELTPTLKVKRRVVDERFAKEIAQLYPAA